MAELINLRQARKDRARREKEAAAAAARAQHGQKKLEKQMRDAARRKAKSALDAHKREGAPGVPEKREAGRDTRSEPGRDGKDQ